jgi:hypothetical protein
LEVFLNISVWFGSLAMIYGILKYIRIDVVVGFDFYDTVIFEIDAHYFKIYMNIRC